MATLGFNIATRAKGAAVGASSLLLTPTFALAQEHGRELVERSSENSANVAVALAIVFAVVGIGALASAASSLNEDDNAASLRSRETMQNRGNVYARTEKVDRVERAKGAEKPRTSYTPRQGGLQYARPPKKENRYSRFEPRS